VTVQPADVEPEEQRGRTADWRTDPNFTWPERLPWSELSPYFIDAWGRANPSNPQPEHEEIVGQNGSGKTRLLMHQLQERYARRRSAAVFICTKADDDIFGQMGWPIIDHPKDIDENPNAIFWARTGLTGNKRREFHERKVSDLLDALWVPKSNRIVAFDEIGYVESLSSDLKAKVQMYWREGRSLGITVVGMKQRPQGALRDMHSEAYWTAAFKPKDRADLERWAELFGARRDWMPVFDSLDRTRYEFLIANPVHEEAYISWVDMPLEPQKVEKQGPSWLRGRGRGQAT
jgi:nucleoside-triphosphatase THEP1